MSRLRALCASFLILHSLLSQSGPVRAEALPSADSVTLTWRAEPQIAATADGQIAVTAPGYALTETPGAPRLPYASALIALPPGATPRLTIAHLVQTDQPLEAPLTTAPWPAAALRGDDRPTTASFVELVELGRLRGVRLARVTFYPVWPTPAGLRVTTTLTVRVDFDTPATAPASSLADDVILAALRSSVVNPPAVQGQAPEPVPETAVTSAPAMLIEVTSAGLTAIRYADLQSAGFPVDSVDPARLQLVHAGREVAAEWDGDADTVFEPAERLLFYAAPRPNRYTLQDGYHLTVAAAPALRMAPRSAAPAGPASAAWQSVLAEQNLIYYGLTCRCAVGRDGERWMWDYLVGPVTRSYTVTTLAAETSQPAQLQAWFVGYTQGGHQVEVSLNGQVVGTALWSGQQAITLTLPVAAGQLLAGPNAVTLKVAAGDAVWLDAVRVDYPVTAQTPVADAVLMTGPRTSADQAPALAAGPRVFLPLLARGYAASAAYSVHLAAGGPYRGYALTDPERPERLTNLQMAGAAVSWGAPTGGVGPFVFVAEADIRPPAAVRAPAALPPAGADYLVIAPAEFAPALAPLLALRQAQGLTTAVADAQAVYDAFDAGRPTAEAVRAFLAEVWATWSPQPQYVLLVGDATYDPKRYRPDSQLTTLPTDLADVDFRVGETAADNRLAAVDGADNLPEFMLGRLPVNTITETQTVVAKLVAYETAPPAGDWAQRVLLVADNADSAGDFAAQADTWAGLLPPALTTQRVYHTGTTAAVTDTQHAILAAWGAGAGLVVYNGHSSQRQWAAERLFHKDDVGALLNGGRLPVVLQMTCLTGAFHDAAQPALDEALLRQADGGAVGVWGPTGLGVAFGHDLMAQAFLQSATQGPAVTAGEAALAGKLALAQNGQQADLIETFTWLGDPATRLQLVPAP